MDLLPLTIVVVLFMCPVLGRTLTEKYEPQPRDVSETQLALQRVKPKDIISLSRVKRTDISETFLKRRTTDDEFYDDRVTSREKTVNPTSSTFEMPIDDDSLLPRRNTKGQIILSRVKRRH